MFDVDPPDPLAVLEAVLQSTDSELLLASEAGRILAGTDGLPGLLGLTAPELAPGCPIPACAELTAGRAELRVIPLRGRRVAYLFRRRTPEHTATEALRRENAALRETLDLLDGTVVVYDSELRYVFANRAYHEFFPHLPDDAALAGRPYRDILAMSLQAGRGTQRYAAGEREAYIAARVAAMRRRPAEPREEFDRRLGRWFLIRVRWTQGGHRVALRVDIDDQKRLQEELLWGREAASTAARETREAIAGAAEALRDPLAALADLVGGHTSDLGPARRAVLKLMALAERLEASLKGRS